MIKRRSVIVFYRRNSALKYIQKIIDVAYSHSKRKYAVGFVNEDKLESVIKAIKEIKHVKTVQERLIDYDDYDIDFNVK